MQEDVKGLRGPGGDHHAFGLHGELFGKGLPKGGKPRRGGVLILAA